MSSALSNANNFKCLHSSSLSKTTPSHEKQVKILFNVIKYTAKRIGDNISPRLTSLRQLKYYYVCPLHAKRDFMPLYRLDNTKTFNCYVII